jgi:tungstate transport system substrate-binding protein
MLAYVLCDRGTFLSFREKIDLLPLVSGSPELENPYGVIVVNRTNHHGTGDGLADKLVDYLVVAQTQALIRDYQVQGESLFYPRRSSVEK